MSKSILNVLVSPSKVASIIERTSRGSAVLSLDIQRHQIGMAIISRDYETLTKQAQTLPSIASTDRPISSHTLEQLSQVVKEHNVCSFVVSWPVQRDHGGMGAPCGRVLFTLESILKESDSILTPDRPMCFWDSLHASEQADGGDEWGRCARYGRPSSKTLHLASIEQYIAHEDIGASQIWDDFCRVHWPERSKVEKTSPLSAWNLVSDWKDCPSSYPRIAAASL